MHSAEKTNASWNSTYRQESENLQNPCNPLGWKMSLSTDTTVPTICYGVCIRNYLIFVVFTEVVKLKKLQG